MLLQPFTASVRALQTKKLVRLTSVVVSCASEVSYARDTLQDLVSIGLLVPWQRGVAAHCQQRAGCIQESQGQVQTSA